MAKITRISREYKSRQVTVHQKNHPLDPKTTVPKANQWPNRDPNFKPTATQKGPPQTKVENTARPVSRPAATPTIPIIPIPSVVYTDGRSPLNNYFDKIFCINLDRRQDRWAQCITEFDKHKLCVERFAAVDGNTMRANGKLTTGEMGCCMSHVGVLKLMIENRWNKILVLEDDISFLENLNEFWETNQKFIPETWNMLYLGGSHLNDPVHLNGPIYKISKTYTTSSYGITLSMANSVVRNIETMGSQVDVMYSEVHRGGSSYTFKPSIAWQRAGISDVQGGFRDYNFLK